MEINHEPSLLPMTGIILAGGKSSRMGRNKAFIEWEGVPLIERSLTTLRGIFAEVFISSNNPELYEKYQVKVVRDNYLDHGPLGGLEACVREADYEYSFFAACDMPYLNGEVIRFMADKISSEDILVPEIDGKLHPLHAFYHKNCLPVLESNLRDKHLKLTKLIRQYGSVIYLQEKDFEGFQDIDRCLSNVNTPQEFLKLQHQNAFQN